MRLSLYAVTVAKYWTKIFADNEWFMLSVVQKYTLYVDSNNSVFHTFMLTVK